MCCELAQKFASQQKQVATRRIDDQQLKDRRIRNRWWVRFSLCSDCGDMLAVAHKIGRPDICEPCIRLQGQSPRGIERVTNDLQHLPVTLTHCTVGYRQCCHVGAQDDWVHFRCIFCEGLTIFNAIVRWN